MHRGKYLEVYVEELRGLMQEGGEDGYAEELRGLLQEGGEDG